MVRSKNVRVDRNWEKKARETMKLGYPKLESSLPEFTRLEMKTPSYPKVLAEIRRNLKKRK